MEADLNALRAVVALVTLSSNRAGVRVTDVYCVYCGHGLAADNMPSRLRASRRGCAGFAPFCSSTPSVVAITDSK